MDLHLPTASESSYGPQDPCMNSISGSVLTLRICHLTTSRTQISLWTVIHQVSQQFWEAQGYLFPDCGWEDWVTRRVSKTMVVAHGVQWGFCPALVCALALRSYRGVCIPRNTLFPQQGCANGFVPMFFPPVGLLPRQQLVSHSTCHSLYWDFAFSKSSISS